MSLATLARKTRAKQRILNTRGKFILNMTGRGNVLGMNAKMSRGNCPGLTKCAGKRAACCNHWCSTTSGFTTRPCVCLGSTSVTIKLAAVTRNNTGGQIRY